MCASRGVSSTAAPAAVSGSGDDTAPPSVDSDVWLRSFFRADQVAFSFGIVAVLAIFVKSLPHMAIDNGATDRVRLGLLGISFVLGVVNCAGLLA